jgi:hypothetical protein
MARPCGGFHLLASVPVTDSPLSSDVFAAAVDTITDETTVPAAPPQLGNVRGEPKDVLGFFAQLPKCLLALRPAGAQKRPRIGACHPGGRRRDDSGLRPRGARPTRASTACSGSGDRAQRSNHRRDGLEATTILKRTPSIDSGSDDSGDNSADLPDNFHSNPSARGDYHDEPTDVDPPSTNPRAQTMAIVQCRA